MKKFMTLIAALLMCVVMVMPVVAAEVEEPKDRVVDDADLLTEAEEDELQGQLAVLSDLHQFDLVVVTTYSTDGKTSQEFADDYFDYGGYGYGPSYDGALLLVNMEASEWYVSTCGSGIDIINDSVLDTMSYEFVPHMSNGDFYAAFTEFAVQCDYYLAGCGMEDGVYEDEYVDGVINDSDVAFSDTIVVVNKSPDIIGIIVKLVVCLIIGFIAALIPMSRLKKQMKNVAMKAEASDYVKPGSKKITKSRDAFLYSNVSRVPKPKDNDSKGGGGGMSFGGGVHIGSSGRSHGGGGGRF